MAIKNIYKDEKLIQEVNKVNNGEPCSCEGRRHLIRLLQTPIFKQMLWQVRRRTSLLRLSAG
jgi:hypothetical protein